MAHVGQKRSWAEDRDDDLLAQLRDGVEGSTVLEGLVQNKKKKTKKKTAMPIP